MPPTTQTVTPRMVSLQYDGANAADILTLIGQFAGPGIYAIESEEDGILTLAPGPLYAGTYNPVAISETDHLIMPDQVSCPDSQFADRYVVLA